MQLLDVNIAERTARLAIEPGDTLGGIPAPYRGPRIERTVSLSPDALAGLLHTVDYYAVSPKLADPIAETEHV